MERAIRIFAEKNVDKFDNESKRSVRRMVVGSPSA